MAEQIKGGLQGRIGLTVYFGFICVFAVRRCALIFLGHSVPDEMSNFNMALYAAFALSGWWLLGRFHKTSDRIAALLYGLFYAIRIGSHFAGGVHTLLLAGAECAVISAGMIAMIVGLIHAITNEKPKQPASVNPTS